MSRLDLPHALRCKRNVVFGNLENIAEFHSNRFLQQLQECKDKPQSVAKVFKNHVSFKTNFVALIDKQHL